MNFKTKAQSQKSKEFKIQNTIQRPVKINPNDTIKPMYSLKGINIKLDESQFCKKCSPHVEIPRLCFLVNISGTNDTTKVCDINSGDIRLLSEFLSGNLKHKDSFDFESPLVKYIFPNRKTLGS